MNYKDYIISKGGKEMGLTLYDIKNHLLNSYLYTKFLDYLGISSVFLIKDLNSHIKIIPLMTYEMFIKGLLNND